MPEIVNTDQGSRFAAEEFTHAVLSRGSRLSKDGKGAWRDNVFVERVYLQAYKAVSAARSDLDTYIDWYNRERVHSRIEDRTPEQAVAA